MKVRTNVTPGKFKKAKGYSRINLHSRKEKDIRAITTAENKPNSPLVFIKSKGKLHNPDMSSDVKKMQRGDALVVDGYNYKYKKNLAKKKK